MKLLTIIEDDRPALLAEITSLLERADISLRDIDGERNSGQAVITLRAEPYELCHKILTEAGYKVFTSDHLLVRIEDHPGALADLSRRLANEQVDIRSIHFVNKEEGRCIVAIEVADPFRAGQVLRDIRVHRED
jgi:hypothetical protein